VGLRQIRIKKQRRVGKGKERKGKGERKDRGRGRIGSRTGQGVSPHDENIRSGTRRVDRAGGKGRFEECH
jgi:hypothetical protein